MRRNEFLRSLSRGLRDLKDEERARYIANYEELLADKLEDGTPEEAAVAELGDPSAIAGTILADAREQGALKPKRSAFTVCLLILGSPVWVSLLAAGFAVLFALYVAVWAVIVAVCAVEFALAAVTPASIVYFMANAASNLPFSLFVLGMGLVCAAVALASWRPVLRLVTGLARGSANFLKKTCAKCRAKGRAKR